MKKEYIKLLSLYFIVLFLLGQVILYSVIQNTIETNKEQGRLLAQTTINQLNLIMLDQLDKTEILEAFLKTDGRSMMDDMLVAMDGSVYLEEFNCIAAELQDTPGVRALQLLPNGVVLYTYPYESNKDAIGDDVLHREERKADAVKAMETGETVVSGPLDLIQGGLGLICRNPIYYDDGTFWGFSAAVLDLPDILVPFGLTGLEDQDYAYRLTAGSGTSMREIASTPMPNYHTPVSAEITVFGQVWTLSVVPESGWYFIPAIFVWIVVVTLLTFVVAYALAHAHMSSLRTKQALEQEREARNVAVHAYESAKIANASKSIFLSTMSHDIRTPMNAIVGLCTLLERDAANKERVLEHTKKISSSSQHLLGLINDILDMSKIESGKTSLHLQEFSLAKVIDECNTILRPQVNGKQQEFIIDAHNILHEHLIGDHLRLNQILLNLLSNAVKYTPSGGHISLLVKECSKTSHAVSEFQFIIRDTGIGMTPDFQEHIFEPFMRATDGRVDKVQGTGLGMTITKSLIDLMGGTIEIQSEPGTGTEITVNLAFRLPETGETKDLLIQHGIHRMLVVDDDPLICNSVVTAMSETDVEVCCTTDGTEALRQFSEAEVSKKPFDVLLLDWKMPQVGGFEIANAIRKQRKDLPIFVLTAYNWSEIETEAENCHISGILTKPFFLSNFVRAIEQLETPSQVKKTDKSPLSGLTILAAEDNEINGEILLEILSMCGASCTLCTDGQQAVEQFEKSSPGSFDLIMMDVQMPIMDGLTATKMIRSSSHPDAKTIPILAMTANAFAEDRKATQEAGMNRHITKPIDLSLLEEAVQSLSLS